MFRLRPEGLEFLESAPKILAFDAEVPAPRQVVFDAVIADPTTWTWFPRLRSGGYDSAPPYGVGSLRHVNVAGAGTYRETIMAWDSPSRWVYRVDATTMPMARALMEEWTFAESNGATRVRWTFAVDPKPMFAVALAVAPGVVGGVFQRAMRNLGRQLSPGTSTQGA